MRQRLLDATVECLVEVGWSGTSTTLVSQRAGVSRGAQLHHFPTKNALVLAAVEHLSEARRDELRAAAADLPRGRGAPSGPRHARRPLHRSGVHRRARAVGGRPHRPGAARGRRPSRAAHRARDPPQHGRAARRRRVGPGVRELVQATLDLVRGLGLANTITDDAARRERILDRWVAHARRPDAPARALRERKMSRVSDRLRGCWPTSRRRVTSSRRWWRRSTRKAGGADTGGRLGRRAPGRAPGVDRRVRRRRGHRQAGLGRPGAAGDRRPGGVRRRRGRTRARRRAAPRSWPAGGGVEPPSSRRCARCPRARRSRGTDRR